MNWVQFGKLKLIRIEHIVFIKYIVYIDKSFVIHIYIEWV